MNFDKLASRQPTQRPGAPSASPDSVPAFSPTARSLPLRRAKLTDVLYNPTVPRPNSPAIIVKSNALDSSRLSRRGTEIQATKLKESAMTLAEQLHEEGMQQGMQQGMEQGIHRGQVAAQQKDILEALEIRFERVPEGLREEIESITDSKKLRHLLRASITSSDLESFAAEL
jgi:flagellar biosynthesis/type III secretory pathway protein FliH